MIHPARTMPFDDLLAGLDAARAAGLVYGRQDTDTGRVLYCYTNRCVYENAWNEFATMARGLILHPGERRVVATPFPKFFNAGEMGRPIPDGSFEAYEKVDGSLAIIHHHGGRWRAATKGAFDSSQAIWTETLLAAQDTSVLVPGTTYLAEAVYPENRIVVRYPAAALVLLGAYAQDGTDMALDALQPLADRVGWRVAARHHYAALADLLADAHALPATAEGFVLRYADGTRLKVKGDEYRRIHALISRCTPLAMWEAMFAGDDLGAIRHDLPEEFLEDFDAITALLTRRLSETEQAVRVAAATVAHLSDKELGLSRGTLPPAVQPFVFPYRKAGGHFDGRMRQALLRHIRPTGNVLDGYVPSYAMGRIMDEAG